MAEAKCLTIFMPRVEISTIAVNPWYFVASTRWWCGTLRNAVAQRLIPIIELHDATGNWDGLEALVDYWINPSTVSVLARHEGHSLIKIGNEVGTHKETDAQFIDGYTRAIQRMRAAGIRAPLVVDHAGWGRNVEQLLAATPRLVQQDPQTDMLFSWHAWDTEGDQTQRATEALELAAKGEIPLIIGEFSGMQVGCRGKIPYQHLLAETKRLGIGWLAWSWGPGNRDCADMDMKPDGRYETLHGWGLEVPVTDENSIANTAIRSRSIVEGSCP